MKGIILAGGSGSRLYPQTSIITKQLLPIYDKPMIYYPLSLLMMVDITEILIISTQESIPQFKSLLGDGTQLGIRLEYIAQDSPDGIAQAYILGEEFLNNDNSIMILGDNLFHGNFNCFRKAIKKQVNNLDNFSARVFAYPVNDPERFGVVSFDNKTLEVLSLEEKPKHPKTNFAVPGIYILDKTAPQKAKNQKPSARGELEILDLMEQYKSDNQLSVEIIERGMAWLDTGTPNSLLDASNFVAIIEQRQGLKISCIEEIALHKSYISKENFYLLLKKLPNGPYRSYLERIASSSSKVTTQIRKAS